ncbi:MULTISPECIES: isocitrate lyase/phosphoenolpyruvate mutase family protein [Actinoplanes]|uniref:isocitrate lyase/PEP mutase family protein n=1 Tax=Actinoplanes TaxID=1865 RepID=UPI0005F2DB2B|nr:MULTISPECIES: isocitrate lyase/phosphoenolpyruvate mutase family protein [Actinoplanes]GLY02160.1 hypothetical protein Acsp01_25390 [Actinoplanes sp. NBRC 101535]
MTGPVERFRALHRPGDPLILPNVWDVLSARLVASLGAAAIATTSAGVAWSRGFRDGGHLPLELLAESTGRIAEAVTVPLTIDIEGGYGRVAETVRAVEDSGAVGVNIEDGGDLGAGVRRIAEARRVSSMFLNARIDGEGRDHDMVARAKAYLDAGADGVFPIGAGPDAVAELLAAVGAPVNVLAGPADWTALGVSRISAGPGLARAAYTTAHDVARDLLATGRITADPALTYGYLNASAG